MLSTNVILAWESCDLFEKLNSVSLADLQNSFTPTFVVSMVDLAHCYSGNLVILIFRVGIRALIVSFFAALAIPFDMIIRLIG